MKKNIVILGSTGSIGKKTLDIIRSNKNKFSVKLLSTNKNVNLIIKQAIEFNVNNIIISDYKSYLNAKIKFKNKNFNISNNFLDLIKIFKKKKIYYTMVAISGLDGLNPILYSIEFSKNLAIVNKEPLICGWSLIKKKLDKFNSNFIPIDSEHFSIFSVLNSKNKDDIEKVYITASGGPFLNYPKNKFDKINVKNALKHPNWKMGKKISIDSATLMNKVFEVIEARNIFNLSLNKISILTHPKSYIHSIIKFKNGLIDLVAHDPDMKIPIYNSLLNNTLKPLSNSKIKFNILNDLRFNEVDKNKFPLVKILDNIPDYSSLFDTIIVVINDYFVNLFLKKKISFKKLMFLINTLIISNDYKKYKKIKVYKVDDIYNLRDYVYLKLKKMSI